ncbi:hypothetical protein M0802_001039 [Mischocyttarus mexicanus]|nr:hypothetical protein M0802_001039 [Mischocyttarus mexicanus]
MGLDRATTIIFPFVLVMLCVSTTSTAQENIFTCDCNHCDEMKKSTIDPREKEMTTIVPDGKTSEKESNGGDNDGNPDETICARDRDFKDKTFSNLCHMLCHNKCTRFRIASQKQKNITRFINAIYRTIPPDILDDETSTDMVVREGNDVTLRCSATGSPAPNITWRREDGQQILLGNGGKVPPMITVPNQLVGAQEGQKMTLECLSEAYPKSINYWTRDNDEIVPQGGKYEPILLDNAYRVHMKLTIHSVSTKDYGSYKCVSRNSLGDTDGSISVYVQQLLKNLKKSLWEGEKNGIDVTTEKLLDNLKRLEK